MIVLPLCSLPNLAWLAHLRTGNEVVIDLGEHFIKQSHRNRFEVLHHLGRQTLSFPVKARKGMHTSSSEVLLDDELHWKTQHWRSVVSAYASSPYFIYYAKDLQRIFSREHLHLGRLNLELLDWLLRALQLPVPTISTQYIGVTDEVLDLRNRFKGKAHQWDIAFPAYPQVFDDRLPFEPNLSGIDLLFNLGPEAPAYLQHIASGIRIS